MSIKAYKYRIYGNRATTEKLQWVLDRCRELYNAALSERKDAYRMAGKSISVYEQKRDLVEIKEMIRPEYQEIASHVLQDVLFRLNKAFDRFFERVKNGEKPGYPRFQGRNRYDSFTYPDGAGWKLDAQKRPPDKKGIVRVNLHLSKLGTVKLHLHRDIAGTIKTLTIKQEGEQWYACFTCEIGKPEALEVAYEDVGIDLGVTHFAALSGGEFIDNPRQYRKAEKKLKKLQEALSRKKRGSHRRKKAVQAVAKAHRKIRNQRQDFLHKESRLLVNRYQVIAFEDLQTTNLLKRPKPKQDEDGTYLPNGAAAKAGLNKSIVDAGWSQFVQYCTYKAAICYNYGMESTGRTNEAIAYLAGLFDGEGSVNIFKQSNRKDMTVPAYFIEISIGNTHKGVLQWVVENFGGRLSHNAEQYTHRNHRTWRWRASSNEAYEILVAILPHLIVKKEQAELVIEFRERQVAYNGRSVKHLTIEELEWRENQRIKLSTIRHWTED